MKSNSAENLDGNARINAISPFRWYISSMYSYIYMYNTLLGLVNNSRVKNAHKGKKNKIVLPTARACKEYNGLTYYYYYVSSSTRTHTHTHTRAYERPLSFSVNKKILKNKSTSTSIIYTRLYYYQKYNNNNNNKDPANAPERKDFFFVFFFSQSLYIGAATPAVTRRQLCARL